jgi:hypothetical protein
MRIAVQRLVFHPMIWKVSISWSCAHWPFDSCSFPWGFFTCSVEGPLLFSFVCKQDEEYRETTVCHYMHQLISALGYLHSQGIAHLDVKVIYPLLIAFITQHICVALVEGKRYHWTHRTYLTHDFILRDILETSSWWRYYNASVCRWDCVNKTNHSNCHTPFTVLVLANCLIC